MLIKWFLILIISLYALVGKGNVNLFIYYSIQGVGVNSSPGGDERDTTAEVESGKTKSLIFQ